MVPGSPDPDTAVPIERVLFVCTGNQCRSPMAEALLRAKLPEDSRIQVASAGTIGNGTPPPDHAVRLMAERGLDIEDRPSRPLDHEMLEEADLVVAMARQHLVEVGAMAPAALERSFTLTDLLDRAGQASGRGPEESVSHWARRMSAGRTPASILSLPSSGDIPDPIGGTRRDFEDCLLLLDRYTTQLASYLCPGASPPVAAHVTLPPARRHLLSWLRPPRASDRLD